MTRFASSRFLSVTSRSPDERRVDTASDVSSSELVLVLPHLAEGGRFAAQAVVEELAALGLAQLRSEERALVDGPVEVDVPRDVPRDALVHGHVAVGLRAHEVRAPEGPDPER